MIPVSRIDGLVVPIDRSNVDTDAILPKQYLKSISKTGFGPYLFDEWRYLDTGDLETDPATRRENPDFALNFPRFAGASILLARENFGCGSSREHAPWALADYGIRALIAPSFADIFYGNCLKNGILPIRLDKAATDQLFERVAASPGYRAVIDLNAQSLDGADGMSIEFVIDAAEKRKLIEGLDDIAITLRHTLDIRRYERRRRSAEPWLFDVG